MSQVVSELVKGLLPFYAVLFVIILIIIIIVAWLKNKHN